MISKDEDKKIKNDNTSFLPMDFFVPIQDENQEHDFSSYKINQYGDVWSIRSERYCRQHPDHKGYYCVQLYNKGTSRKYVRRIARLVLYMFKPINVSMRSYQVDHIDQDRSNNYIANLRLASNGENKRNNHKYNRCSSRFKGVSWNMRQQKWYTNIRYFKKLIYLGCYHNEYEAGFAYDYVARKLHNCFYCNDEFNDCDKMISKPRRCVITDDIEKRLAKINCNNENNEHNTT